MEDDGMNDAERKAYWDQITDPVEMLKAIVDNAEFLGGDPYYNDLVDALVTNAARVSKLGQS